MAVPDTNKVILNTESAWAEFYTQYGKVMLAWALVESELSTLFSLLTHIAPDMGVKIFYAPRSFKGRTEIFKSALPVCKIPDHVKSFTRALIKKADQYSDCRNKFAHDQPLLHQKTVLSFPPEYDVCLVDAKGQFQRDEEKQRYLDEAITTKDVAQIATQFMALSQLVRDSWIELRGNPAPSLDTLRARLAALPTLPPPKVRSPHNEEL